MIRASGRSWWQCRYSSGKRLAEWDTMTTKVLLPSNNGKSSRWEDVPKDGMVGLRLLCPNGMAGELEAPEGHKFFQLKVGGIGVSMGFAGDGKGVTRYCDAHIIGVVLNSEGDCLCRAWETKEKRLIEFRDNVYGMKYRQIGRLSLDVQQLKI
jgi:hypothetical protein